MHTPSAKGTAVHIGVGFLRCSFLWVGIAKALNTERAKVGFPRSSVFYNAAFFLPTGSRGEDKKQHIMIHIGQLIERTLHDQGRTVTWFAAQLCCTRPNIYKIFAKENIDLHLLWRISAILGHDFFRDISACLRTDGDEEASK